MFMVFDLMFIGELDVFWISNQVSKGFMLQCKLYLLELIERCYDFFVIMNMIIIFVGDYDIIVKGKEEEFEKYCVDIFLGYYLEVIISDCKVSKGSIMVLFNMIVLELKWNVMVVKVWDDVVKGMIFDFNGEIIIILLCMQIDGQVFFKELVVML